MSDRSAAPVRGATIAVPSRLHPGRLLAWVLALAVLAGCTTVSGTPRAASGPDAAGASGSGQAAGVSGDAPHAAEPSTQQRIAAALAAGEIDEPTSWLYRTWAQFADPSLPDRFRGKPDGHDIELLTSMPFRLADLPTDVRNQVEPYLLRPTDPDSAFTAGDDPPGLRSKGSLLLTADDQGPWPYEPCRDGWVAENVPDLPFKVWACLGSGQQGSTGASGTGAPGTDTSSTNTSGAAAADEAAARIAATIRVVEAHAGQMIADMGPVIPDDPSTDPHPESDDRIDIYVLPAHSRGPDRGSGADLFDNYMQTVSAAPNAGVTTSAYVLASAEELTDPAMFERELVHELFHVLQYTHHARLGSRWFYDASAEWAAAHYVRHDSARLHAVRLPIMQNAVNQTLQDEYGLHPYGAYLWPLFMEQQAGAESVFATWKDLAALSRGGNRSSVIAVLDKHLDVGEHFAQFVMQLYNAELPGNPIRPAFVDLDPQFPAGTTPTAWQSRTLKPGQPLEWDLPLVLGTGYYYAPVAVPRKDPGSDHGVLVTIAGDLRTFDGQLPSLAALVKGGNGTFRRQAIRYSGDGQRVCVKDDVILVLSNSETDVDNAVEGSLRLERVEDADGTEQRCGQVQANDPESLAPLATSGDVIRVDGTEDDGKPDTAPILVTVSGVPREDSGAYRVTVTLTGGTLNGSRELAWSLDDFTAAGEDTYRKRAAVRLDTDLTDANRPLTIDVRLTRGGDEVDSHAPTVDLHGEQPSECSTDVTVSGEVTHPIMHRGATSYEYRGYPIDHSEHLQWPVGVSAVTLDEYGDTTLQMVNYTPQTELGGNMFRWMASSFGAAVPAGETGTFTLESDLTYRDYENAPWMLWDEDRPLPNGGKGIPLDATSSLRGDVTLELTRHSVGVRPAAAADGPELTYVKGLEGTLTGDFTDRDGAHLRLEATFTYASNCGI